MLRSYGFIPSAMKWTVRTFLVNYVPKRIFAQISRSVDIVNDSETLDRFIDNLMTNKMNKWRSRNEAKSKSDMKIPISGDMSHPHPADSSSEFTCSTVNDYVCKNLTSPHLDAILNVCLEKEVSPSPETLMKAAHVFAKTGNKTGIEAVISLTEVGNDCDERMKGEFQLYKAEAIWRGGESIQKSLSLLHDAYKNQPGLRRYVRSSLKALIGEVIDCRGEASLVQVKNLVLQLAAPPYEDVFPLSYLWGRCILSEWFADQQMSVEIITLGRSNPQFIRALENRLDAVVGEALESHKVDAVYRVLEVLLELSLTKPAQAVLGKLFDYKYIMGDKKGCEAIIKLCAFTNLNIGSTRRKQFENAPARWKNRRNMIIACKNSEKLQDSTEILPVPKFKFKL